MANVRFVLRNFKAKTPQKIYLRYRATPKQDFKYSLELKILPKYWDKEKERIKNTTEVKERQAINNYLTELNEAFETFKNEATTKKESVTNQSLRGFLDSYLIPINPTEKTLFGFIEMYIEQSKTRVNEKTGRKLSRFPMVAYGTLLSNLKDFQKHYKKAIDFQTIDLDFYSEFTAFLSKKELSVNTIAKKITTLKAILNVATDKGINTNLAYKSKRFTAITEESDSIYLNETELIKLSKLDLSQNERLDRVRDLFLIGAYTGLRFSDFTRLTADNINNGILEMHQAKTAKKVVVPITDTVQAIINKHNGKAPKSLSNQKMNEYLKEVGLKANLIENVSKTITKGGKQTTTHRPKYEYLTTHTARRSFATNAFKNGIPSLLIMAMTGHKSEKSFLKYIKASQHEMAEKFAVEMKRNTKLKIA